MINWMVGTWRENKGVRIANDIADAELMLLQAHMDFENAEANIAKLTKRIKRLKMVQTEDAKKPIVKSKQSVLPVIALGVTKQKSDVQPPTKKAFSHD